jgi:hypothetical protein
MALLLCYYIKALFPVASVAPVATVVFVLDYQPQANSVFLSEQINYQQSTFFPHNKSASPTRQTNRPQQEHSCRYVFPPAVRRLESGEGWRTRLDNLIAIPAFVTATA